MATDRPVSANGPVRENGSVDDAVGSVDRILRTLWGARIRSMLTTRGGTTVGALTGSAVGALTVGSIGCVAGRTVTVGAVGKITGSADGPSGRILTGGIDS